MRLVSVRLRCEEPGVVCTLRCRDNGWRSSRYVCRLNVHQPDGKVDMKIGRTEFAIDEDTVDFDVPKPVPGLDESELQVSRQYTYFLRVLRNVRGTASMHGSIKKRNKEWALDPQYIEHDKDYTTFFQDLPNDMHITFPADNSAPWIPSHFIAQVHAYHHLSIILQHRPQMHFLSAKNDASWKQHMRLSYKSAKQMCRLQEAILQEYGLSGLMCMQRGLAFTIYSILSCTMLHLVCI